MSSTDQQPSSITQNLYRPRSARKRQVNIEHDKKAVKFADQTAGRLRSSHDNSEVKTNSPIPAVKINAEERSRNRPGGSLI